MFKPFQQRVHHWMMVCFGKTISADKQERNHRFLEEAIELVQSAGCTASEAHQLVDYVFGRPVGELNQEIGGVMVTLAALASAHDASMADSGEIELLRIWGKVEAIRAKQAAKPPHSPLPVSPIKKRHEWVDSTLGHGEQMCKNCFGTNRELAALNSLAYCEGLNK